MDKRVHQTGDGGEKHTAVIRLAGDGLEPGSEDLGEGGDERAGVLGTDLGDAVVTGEGLDDWRPEGQHPVDAEEEVGGVEVVDGGRFGGDAPLPGPAELDGVDADAGARGPDAGSVHVAEAPSGQQQVAGGGAEERAESRDFVGDPVGKDDGGRSGAAQQADAVAVVVGEEAHVRGAVEAMQRAEHRHVDMVGLADGPLASERAAVLVAHRALSSPSCPRAGERAAPIKVSQAAMPFHLPAHPVAVVHHHQRALDSSRSRSRRGSRRRRGSGATECLDAHPVRLAVDPVALVHAAVSVAVLGITLFLGEAQQ